MGERKLEIGFQVPLELENVPSGLMVANEVPSTIDVRISGPRTLLMNLQPNDISIAVDLEGLPPGTTTFRRLEERLNIPTALKVTRLFPSFVDVKLERVKQKTVPIKPVFSGAPAEGYRIGDVQVTPRLVTVEGAESELGDIAEVPTDPVNIEGSREDFTLTASLNYQGKYSALKNHQAAEVRVTIEPAPAPEMPGNEETMSGTEKRKQS
ncbi:MAG: CdaR family protein [Desulfuromonadales bacterium]